MRCCAVRQTSCARKVVNTILFAATAELREYYSCAACSSSRETSTKGFKHAARSVPLNIQNLHNFISCTSCYIQSLFLVIIISSSRQQTKYVFMYASKLRNILNTISLTYLLAWMHVALPTFFFPYMLCPIFDRWRLMWSVPFVLQ